MSNETALRSIKSFHGHLTVRLGDEGPVVVSRVTHANTYARRLLGWLGRRGVEQQEGLLITPAHTIHSFAMRFRFDVVFLDRSHRVVECVPSVVPWRVVRGRGHAALELPEGTVERFQIHTGQRLCIEKAAPMGRL